MKLHLLFTLLFVWSLPNLVIAQLSGFEEKQLITLPAGTSIIYPTFSPNGKSVAYMTKSGNKWFYVIDGVWSDPFDRVHAITFSPDSSKTVYRAVLENKEFIVVGQTKSEPFEEVSFPCFSPSGELIYFAKENGKYFFVIEGKRREAFDYIFAGTLLNPIPLTKDGDLVYAAEKDGKQFVVVGETKGEAFDEVGFIEISPAKTRIAYPAKKDGSWFIVVDGKKGKPFDYVNWPEFSPNGEVITYEAIKRKKEYIVTNDKRGKAFDRVGFVYFSEEGKIGYEATKNILPECFFERGIGYRKVFVIAENYKSKVQTWVGGIQFNTAGEPIFRAEAFPREFVTIGDHKGEVFDDIGTIEFSPNKKTIAYLATNSGECVIVVGTKKKIKAFSGAEDLLWSIDGTYFIYVAKSQEQRFVVIDSRPGELFSYVWTPQLSPNGQVVYKARQDNKQFVVVGETKSEPFDDVWDFHFSADGTKLAYGARKGDTLWWEVQDVPAPYR